MAPQTAQTNGLRSGLFGSGSPPGLDNRHRKQSLTVTLVFEFLTVGTIKRAKLRHRAKCSITTMSISCNAFEVH